MGAGGSCGMTTIGAVMLAKEELCKGGRISIGGSVEVGGT